MKQYFKGWYFKVQSDKQAVAIIPAMHIDKSRKKSASIQIITESAAWALWFPYDQFICKGNQLQIKIGDNEFTQQGLKLHIETDTVSAYGDLQFGPLTPLAYDIMGPFCYVPFMECRHSVFSMTHQVKGTLHINQKEYRFDESVGYIEGDRGRSFPSVYLWTQCNFFDETPNSIMLSVAKIPLGFLDFTGIIGVIFWHGKEYRIATYLGAKVVKIGKGEIVIKQGGLKLTAVLIEKQGSLLYAPVSGNMERLIHESLFCTAYYMLEEDDRKIFEFRSDRASFEYEYDQ
jgi:hypothetical protein